ncbi:MAG: glycosyltransferase [Brevundimonas sp.]|uniref:glycosyltransferase n=1 Tax=Brevundimonas sp. TaxID=1871086 RepID=UPI00391A013D
MRFLFTTFEGGGHVPPALLMARTLQQRGHEVLVVSDPANALAAQAAGLAFTPWRTAPRRLATAQVDDPLQDWRRRWPPAVVRAVCRAVMTGPALDYARDTRDLIQAFDPDLIVSNELLLGCLLAAEAGARPVALLTGNLWPYPTRPDLPPFGPGWAPPRTERARRAHDYGRGLIGRWFDAGLPALNAARAEFGLAPLDAVLDQLDAAQGIVLGASRAFDYGLQPPQGYVHAGALIDFPPAPPETSAPGSRPKVLISFSTTFQNQTAVMARCLRALAPLPVDVIATTGPAVDPRDLPCPANAQVTPWADHDRLVPECSLVICHGGHGTLLRPLRHGVPVLCLPMGRDHPENGRRLVEHGAGLMARKGAPPRRLRALALRLLDDARYARAADRLGKRILADQPQERAAGVAALEGLTVRSEGSVARAA